MLRKEKKWSQEELANKIPIDRTVVVKWEKGRRLPDIQTIEILKSLFNVTADEILAGERNPKRDITLEVYQSKLKYRKLFWIVVIILFILLLIFLGQYFINQYKSVKIYTISAQSDNFKLSNGMLVKTNGKLYFAISQIESNYNINKIELLEIINNDEKVIYETNDDSFILYDYNNYNEYFDFENINKTINNLYLKISFNNQDEIIKLTFEKDYENNELIKEIPFKEISHGPNITSYNINQEFIETIKQKATRKDDIFIYEFNQDELNYIVKYYINNNVLSIEAKGDSLNLIEEFIYNLELKSIHYNYYINSRVLFSYFCDINSCNCLKGICNNINEKNSHFFELLSSIK